MGADVAQAIRRLGEDFPKDKAKIIQTLTPIAKGKKAQDPQGFAREHAIRALRRLGSNMALPAQKGDRQLTRDLLGWFPGDVKVVGAIYIASAAEADPKIEGQFRQFLKKLIPQREYDQIFDLITTNGHVCDTDLPQALALLATSDLARTILDRVIPLDALVGEGLLALAERRTRGKVVVALA